MTKRRLENHEQCLRIFGERFKSTVKANIKFWNDQDTNLAEARAAAFELVRADLIEAARSTGVELQDIGIEDFDVPEPHV